jgi:excisionase family DNA binding protein
MDVMSVSEVAKLTGKSEQWIRHLCTVGKLEAIKIGKRTWMIKGDKDVLSSQTQKDDKAE